MITKQVEKIQTKVKLNKTKGVWTSMTDGKNRDWNVYYSTPYSATELKIMDKLNELIAQFNSLVEEVRQFKHEEK